MKPPFYGNESGQGGLAMRDGGKAGRRDGGKAGRQKTVEVGGFCDGLGIQFPGQAMIRHQLSWRTDEGTTPFQTPRVFSGNNTNPHTGSGWDKSCPRL